MQTGRTEKIGNVVLDYSHYPEQDFYCDGASEDALLELVKTIPPREYPQEIYKAASWEVLYHLSDLRENIVGWLPVDKSMKVLEIGSGCGAITGSLAQKAGSVTCVDLSKKRSLINAYRGIQQICPRLRHRHPRPRPPDGHRAGSADGL